MPHLSQQHTPLDPNSQVRVQSGPDLATAAGGGRAAARALAAGDGGDDASPGALGRIEERLARIEETLREVAARPSKNS